MFSLPHTAVRFGHFLVVVACASSQFPQSAFAQGRTGVVEIRVAESTSEAPIAKADVRLSVFGEGNFSYQLYVDGGGHGSLPAVLAGQYTATAIQPGYETTSVRVEVFAGQFTNVLISMKRLPSASPPGVAAVSTVKVSDLKIPQSARREFEAGLAVLKSSPAEASKHFESAIHLYSKYAEAHLELAIASLTLNQRPQALAAVNQAIALNPSLSQAYTLRGRILIEDRKYVDAEKDFRQAIQLDPSSWYPHFELARTCYKLNRTGEAIREAVVARNLPGALPSTHLLLADLYSRSDDLTSAIQEMEDFLVVAPEDPLAPQVRKKLAELQHPE